MEYMTVWCHGNCYLLLSKELKIIMHDTENLSFVMKLNQENGPETTSTNVKKQVDSIFSSTEEPFVISLAGLRGGTGKTTLTFELGKAFATHGKRVLLVDMDPKADLTNLMGITPNPDFFSMGTVLLRETTIHNVLGKKADISIALTSREMACAEAKLYQPSDGIMRLDEALKKVYPMFDIILIDCPPFLGRLTQNALVASDLVINPVLEDLNIVHAVQLLEEEMASIRAYFNSDLAPVQMVKVYQDRIGQDDITGPSFEELINMYSDQTLEVVVDQLSRIRKGYYTGQLDMNMVSTESILQLCNELKELYMEG